MRNGSVLMSARIGDPQKKNADPHHPDTDKTRMGTSRGFARSDDGTHRHRADMQYQEPQLLSD